MLKPRKILFLLSDGGRARLVRRSPESGDFVTVEELDHSHNLKGSRGESPAGPAPKTVSIHAPHRHSVGRQDFLRQAKANFAAEAARLAKDVMRAQGLDEIFLAAPPRMIGLLRQQFDAATPVAGTLGKDLTKVPNHSLHDWLDEALFAVRAAG